MAVLGSLTLPLSAGVPPSQESFSLSACVPPQTIHLQILDKSPLSGSGRGPPSCNKIRSYTRRMVRTEPGVLLM